MVSESSRTSFISLNPDPQINATLMGLEYLPYICRDIVQCTNLEVRGNRRGRLSVEAGFHNPNPSRNRIMHIAPSKRRSPAPPGPPSPNRHRDAQMMNKRVLQAAHHVANAAVIAFAAPISITRQSRRVAYTARALWATWSGVSVRDFHVDRRESIMGLAESRDKRMAAARQLDRALVGASLKSEISNVEVMALYWENREKLRLEGAGGGRRALMRCRMDREFDDRFVQTLNARIEAYYSPRAILTKSLLSFATLGMIPHMMRMLWFNAGISPTPVITPNKFVVLTL
eukprot:1394828-Amorphochlora_amoeboformis.AAC.1